MSNKVTYGDIVDALSRKTGLSKQKSEAFAKALTARIIDELQETGKASITNFGSFNVKEVAERQGQNPQTGEPITIPAHKRVNFSPYKALREEVNAKYTHLEPELISEASTESGTSSTTEKEEQDQEQKAKSTAQFSGVNDVSEDEKEAPLKEESILEEENDEVRADPVLPKVEKKKKKKLSGLSMFLAILIPLIIIGGITWFLMQPDSTSRLADQKEAARSELPKATQGEAEKSQKPEKPTIPEATEQLPETADNPKAGASEKYQETASNMNASSKSYEVQKDEWYWRIARNVYGNAQFWPLIYQANFTVNDHPDTLEKNVGLTIPALEGTARNLAKSDYLRLASAFEMVAEAYHLAGLSEKSTDYGNIARKWERKLKWAADRKD